MSGIQNTSAHTTVSRSIPISSLLVTCELFHLLRVVTNTLQLLTGTIYRMTLETVALLAFLSVNLKSAF